MIQDSTRAPGIETVYRGHRFRSRLEARWAAFFDLVHWPWEYEPIDLDGYIPDFVVKFAKPLLVEVKPEFSLSGLQQYRGRIDESGWSGQALIVGAGLLDGDDFIGLCRLSEKEQIGPDEFDFWWGEAMSMRCGHCRVFSFYHLPGVWNCARCGGYESRHTPASDFTELWGRAHERTRWAPGRRR